VVLTIRVRTRVDALPVLERTPHRERRNFFIGAVFHFIAFYALAHMYVVFSLARETHTALVFPLLLVLGAMTARQALFESRSVSYLFINTLYTLVAVLSGGYVIMYWPW
jgi:hypothetical protein